MVRDPQKYQTERDVQYPQDIAIHNPLAWGELTPEGEDVILKIDDKYLENFSTIPQEVSDKIQQRLLPLVEKAQPKIRFRGAWGGEPLTADKVQKVVEDVLREEFGNKLTEQEIQMLAQKARPRFLNNKMSFEDRLASDLKRVSPEEMTERISTWVTHGLVNGKILINQERSQLEQRKVKIVKDRDLLSRGTRNLFANDATEGLPPSIQAASLKAQKKEREQGYRGSRQIPYGATKKETAKKTEKKTEKKTIAQRVLGLFKRGAGSTGQVPPLEQPKEEVGTTQAQGRGQKKGNNINLTTAEDYSRIYPRPKEEVSTSDLQPNKSEDEQPWLDRMKRVTAKVRPIDVPVGRTELKSSTTGESKQRKPKGPK